MNSEIPTKEILRAIQNSIAAHPPDFNSYDSLLDMLYWHCTESDILDNDKIRSHFDALRKIVPLSREKYDEMLYIVSDLCLEHGRLSFIEGLRFGVVLMQELNI